MIQMEPKLGNGPRIPLFLVRIPTGTDPTLVQMPIRNVLSRRMIRVVNGMMLVVTRIFPMHAPWQLPVDEYEVAYGQKMYNVG